MSVTFNPLIAKHGRAGAVIHGWNKNMKTSQFPKRVRDAVGDGFASDLERQYNDYVLSMGTDVLMHLFKYQPNPFELSADVQYRPDFLVSYASRGQSEIIEVKGCHVDKRIKARRVLRPYWRDSGDRVRYLWAREKFGHLYRFLIAMRDTKTGEWQHVEK